MKAKQIYEILNNGFIPVSEIIPGQKYMAQDCAYPGDFIPVKVIFVQPDGSGMYDVTVEYEGIEDKWYLDDNDLVFKKM